MTKEGKAYAFFDCDAPIQAIESELPTIRQMAQTPTELELKLEENTPSIRAPPEVLEIAEEARKAGVKYYIEATLPEATNRQTATEIGGILNQAYQSPLYREGEPFRGEIGYEKNGQYLSLE